MIKNSETGIIDCCLRRLKTYKNYTWAYNTDTFNLEDKINYATSSNTRAKAVGQFSKLGKLLKTWKSITEASNFLNIQHTCISACCRKIHKTAGGFIWKFI